MDIYEWVQSVSVKYYWVHIVYCRQGRRDRQAKLAREEKEESKMYEKYKLSDVPIDVLKAEIAKWEDIEVRGFDCRTDWNRCALCDWVDEAIVGMGDVLACDMCPISPEWCRNSTSSKLYNADAAVCAEFIEILYEEIERRERREER